MVINRKKFKFKDLCYLCPFTSNRTVENIISSFLYMRGFILLVFLFISRSSVFWKIKYVKKFLRKITFFHSYLCIILLFHAHFTVSRPTLCPTSELSVFQVAKWTNLISLLYFISLTTLYYICWNTETMFISNIFYEVINIAWLKDKCWNLDHNNNYY